MVGEYSLQAALSAMDISANADDRQKIVAAKCRGLMAGYHARWSRVAFEIEDVEVLTEASLFNVDTNRPSRTFSLAGKLDAVVIHNGQRIIIDHKTTSQDIADPDAPYWRQLAIEGQVSLYMVLEWLNARKADYALWDVVRKPTISPKKLAAAEKKSVLMVKHYFGRVVSDEDLQSLQATDRETPAMYEARLADDCAKERPNWYFQRRMVPRINQEIREYMVELWNHSQEMISARANNRHDRNPGACLLYNTPCKFLGICSGHDQPDSDKWQKKAQVHAELPLIGDGRDVLTNSRIRTFQTCRKKHFFEYELGIERQDEEEREALFFGSLFHRGLEAWLKSAQTTEENNEHNSYGSSVNAAEQSSTTQVAI